jgi:hypothetical protein
MTISTIDPALLHDLEAPAHDLYGAIREEERIDALLLEGVKQIARRYREDDPTDHRTGCVTNILKAVADVLINERGWDSRTVVDALALEAIRAGGDLENAAKAKARAKWEARQKAKVSS